MAATSIYSHTQCVCEIRSHLMQDLVRRGRRRVAGPAVNQLTGFRGGHSHSLPFSVPPPPFGVVRRAMPGAQASAPADARLARRRAPPGLP